MTHYFRCLVCAVIVEAVCKENKRACCKNTSVSRKENPCVLARGGLSALARLACCVTLGPGLAQSWETSISVHIEAVAENSHVLVHELGTCWL